MVGGVKCSGEAAEKVGEGEVCFAVAVVGGGVEYDGCATGGRGRIARPEVTVEERRRWMVVC